MDRQREEKQRSGTHGTGGNPSRDLERPLVRTTKAGDTFNDERANIDKEKDITLTLDRLGWARGGAARSLRCGGRRCGRNGRRLKLRPPSMVKAGGVFDVKPEIRYEEDIALDSTLGRLEVVSVIASEALTGGAID